MTIHFSCTMCGRCCHGLRLPVSVDEAMAWLEDGGRVELFCEAIPWPEEPSADNLPAWYKRRRSFAASSGQLPLRVIVSLMATFEGACPNLRSDMSCGIYARRPRACRVYPAEVNPFVALDTEAKQCPPEAWKGGPVLRNDEGEWTDPDLARAIVGMRDADARDAEIKARACAILDIATSGLSNEGVVIHAPTRERLLAALETARTAVDVAEHARAWRIVSNRQGTLDLLSSAGTASLASFALDDVDASYLGFLPAEFA
jgi:Fe-S-cluster containining protein